MGRRLRDIPYEIDLLERRSMFSPNPSHAVRRNARLQEALRGNGVGHGMDDSGPLSKWQKDAIIVAYDEIFGYLTTDTTQGLGHLPPLDDFIEIEKKFDQIRAATPTKQPVDELRKSVELLNLHLSASLRLAKETEKNSTRRFWLGVVLGIPTGLIGTYIGTKFGIG
jgi:hypothetical protein